MAFMPRSALVLLGLVGGAAVAQGCSNDGAGDACKVTKDCLAGLICDLNDLKCKKPKDLLPQPVPDAAPLPDARPKPDVGPDTAAAPEAGPPEAAAFEAGAPEAGSDLGAVDGVAPDAAVDFPATVDTPGDGAQADGQIDDAPAATPDA
jgi:hypothetical protein